MNFNKIITINILALCIMILFSGIMSGCSKDNPVQPSSTSNYADDTGSLSKPTGRTRNTDYSTPTTVYPISASKITYFKNARNMYNKNTIDLLPTNSVFDFDMGSLTPPSSINWGDPVEITFSVDKNSVNNELIFSFGPSGCHFDPAARVILDYSELGIDNPTLYYIENDGSYTEQIPESIDVSGKWMTILIDHFSRYAVAYGG